MQLMVYQQRNAGKLTVEELKYAVRWFAEKLLGPELIKRLFIEIKLKRRYDYWATCVPMGTSPSDMRRNFMIEMQANKLGRKCQLQNLAHEMAHVKQWVKGELERPPELPVFRWKKRWQRDATPEERSRYLKLPYEVDAIKIERRLTKQYLQHLRDEGITF